MPKWFLGPALLCLCSCGSSFPTGTFNMVLTPTTNNCNATVDAPPALAVTIEAEGSGYTVILPGNTGTVLSANSTHLTFVTGTSTTSIGACTFEESDHYTLVTKGKDIAGSMLAALTPTSGCDTCGLNYSVVATKVSD